MSTKLYPFIYLVYISTAAAGAKIQLYPSSGSVDISLPGSPVSSFPVFPIHSETPTSSGGRSLA